MKKLGRLKVSRELFAQFLGLSDAEILNVHLDWKFCDGPLVVTISHDQCPSVNDGEEIPLIYVQQSIDHAGRHKATIQQGVDFA